MTRFTSETRSLAEERIARLEALGIECRIQQTYFDDEVCVHINGHDRPASIYGPVQFINWAGYFLHSPAPAGDTQ